MLLCVQDVTVKGRPKFSSCQSLEVSKYMNLALVRCSKLDPRAKPPPPHFLKVVYALAFYIWLLPVFAHFNCLHVCCLLFTYISHLLTVTAVSACFCALVLLLPGYIIFSVRTSMVVDV